MLENAHLRAELVAGRHGRQPRPQADRPRDAGRAGQPARALRRRPVAFDAWDIDPFHLETRRDCAAGRVVRGRDASRRCAPRSRSSDDRRSEQMTQIVRLDAGSRRLEFHTTVDWHEEHTLLKVCFPLAVRAPNATYEMPFGYAERPTHYSTSCDRARYEVPGHRFADLSEHGFGVAAPDRLKYGYSCLRQRAARSACSARRGARIRRPTGPARVRLRAAAARRRLARRRAWSPRRVRFNAPLRWVDGQRLPDARSPRSTIRTSCSTRSSGRRTRTRSCSGCTRRTERAALRGCGSARRSASARLANALEEDGEPLDVDGRRRRAAVPPAPAR